MKEERRNSVRDQLILDHIHLVKIIALKISARLPPHIELDDLIHSGVIGLIDAAGKFNAQKGIKFSTYASLRIRGAIMDDLRHLDWATRTQRQKIKDLERLTIELNNRLGHPPSEEELALEMKIELVELHRLLEESRGIGLGVFRYHEDQEGQIGDERTLLYSSEDKAPDPGQQLMEEELKTVLADMVEQLPHREKMVISLYYQEDLNLKEIGRIMDLTESRISQIRTLALARIRSRLEQMTAGKGTKGKSMV